MSRRVAGRIAAAGAVVLFAGGCLAAPQVNERPAAPGSRLITREEIARSGAVDGLEALKRAGSFVVVGERKSGDIRASARGRSSFLISPQMLLVVDEVIMTDLNSLRDIRADTIEWMRVMSGAQATPYYGTPASNGVLVVRTRIPVDR